MSDTNVFVSRFRPSIAARQLADGHSKPPSHEFMDRWMDGDFDMLCCLEAWYEIIEKLEQFGVPEHMLRKLGGLLHELCEPVEIVSSGRWCTDPDDDKWLRMAIDGGATHLVSADRKVHSAKGPFEFRRVRIPGFLYDLRAELKLRARAA